MKNLSPGLGIVLGMLSPLTVQADPAPAAKATARVVVTATTLPTSKTPVRVQSLRELVYAPASMRNLYFISNTTFAGSHVPVVVRRCNGHFEVANGAALAHGGADALAVGTSTSSDVVSILKSTDPSFR